MRNKRNYGIDLLRLVLMFMVCMLHTLGQGGVLKSTRAGTVGYRTFWFLEILCYCAVDGFALISGYMATDKPRKYEKILDMWFQAFFYSFVVTWLFTLAGFNESWEKAEIIKCALPVTYGKFWYFTAFFVLFFATPILNKFIFSVDESTAKKAFLILVVMFCGTGMLADPFKAHSGYSAIWLIVLYCMGGLAKRIKLFESQRSIILILLWAWCIFFTWGMRVFFKYTKLVNYVSPTILLSGMIMVVLFSRLRLKGTIIAKLSPLAFGIYLFQLNQVIWENIIKEAAVFAASKNIAVGVLGAFGVALAIFSAGLVVEFVRRTIAKLLRIPVLSRMIVRLVDMLLMKVSVILR